MKNEQRKAMKYTSKIRQPETSGDSKFQRFMSFEMLILHEICETQSLVGNHLDTINYLAADVQ